MTNISTPTLKDGYTYADYLQAWANQYGDDLRAEVEGATTGTTYHIHRLSEAEFNLKIDQLDALYGQIDAATSYEQGRRLFERAFPHEIALLI